MRAPQCREVNGPAKLPSTDLCGAVAAVSPFEPFVLLVVLAVLTWEVPCTVPRPLTCAMFGLGPRSIET